MKLKRNSGKVQLKCTCTNTKVLYNKLNIFIHFQRLTVVLWGWRTAKEFTMNKQSFCTKIHTIKPTTLVLLALHSWTFGIAFHYKDNNLSIYSSKHLQSVHNSSIHSYWRQPEPEGQVLLILRKAPVRQVHGCAYGWAPGVNPVFKVQKYLPKFSQVIHLNVCTVWINQMPQELYLEASGYLHTTRDMNILNFRETKSHVLFVQIIY